MINDMTTDFILMATLLSLVLFLVVYSIFNLFGDRKEQKRMEKVRLQHEAEIRRLLTDINEQQSRYSRKM